MDGKRFVGIGVLAAAVLLAGAAGANAATITATSDKASVVAGEEFTITLSTSGWTKADSADSVDAVEFSVEYDDTLFEFVSGFIVDDGTEFLAKDDQDGSCSAGDASLHAAPTYAFRVEDTGLGFPGSHGPAGDLGGLTLKAKGPLGIGSIDVKNPAGGEDEIFFDPDGFGIPATGGVTLVDTSVEVVPEPASAATAGLLAALMGLRRRRRRG